MERLTFYFDPLCPWCWVTAVWVQEVRKQREIDVEWKFFSLAEVNELDAARYAPLRIAALARREGGNEAVEKTYFALGRLIHEQGVRVEPLDEFLQVAEEQLQAVGLDGGLVQRAVQDESTRDDVVAEHKDAVERFGAFGVPWLVIGDDEFGFFGPVIGELLTGEKAVELWDHTRWALDQPYFYELKRGERKLPPLRKREVGAAARSAN